MCACACACICIYVCVHVWVYDYSYVYVCRYVEIPWLVFGGAFTTTRNDGSLSYCCDIHLGVGTSDLKPVIHVFTNHLAFACHWVIFAGIQWVVLVLRKLVPLKSIEVQISQLFWIILIYLWGWWWALRWLSSVKRKQLPFSPMKIPKSISFFFF